MPSFARDPSVLPELPSPFTKEVQHKLMFGYGRTPILDIFS